jgi:hypothetical protein
MSCSYCSNPAVSTVSNSFCGRLTCFAKWFVLDREELCVAEYMDAVPELLTDAEVDAMLAEQFNDLNVATHSIM